MAGKKSYAGIEIEFTANYSDLVESLKKIDNESQKLSTDLKSAQKALKLDPENTELQAAAQKTLANAIVNVNEKLKLLKSTEKEIRDQYEQGAIPVEQYVRFQAELTRTISSLEKYKAQVKDTASADDLAEDMMRAKSALKEYKEQLDALAGSDDEQAIYEIDKAIADTTNKIEEYKRRIQALISDEGGLEQAQGDLKQSTKDLSNAQNEAANSAAKMGEGYTVTKGIISDLASKVIQKTASSLISFAKSSVEAASALYEVENVVDVAFEDMRGKVDEFAKSSIETYGISELTAKRTAALYTSMAKAMDITLDKSSDMAIALAQRSADMASFYDISQDITSTALKSVFTGETESLKRFGVVMTEVNLQQYAYSQGIEKSIKDMTQAEKVQLRFNYLMQQTSAAGGDFARTSDSFANKTRQLKERLTETSIVIGNQFIKNLDGAFNTLDDFLAKVKEAGENGELDDTIRDISDILKNLLSMLTSVGEVLLKYPKLTAGVATGFTAMRTVSKLNKPFETFASNVGKLAFNMSDATEQTGLLSSKLTMSAGAWAGVASAALTAGLALKDYIERQREELRTRDSLTAEQRKAVDAARELTESYQENADSVNENVAGIEATYKAYKEQAARLTELANKQDKTKSDLSEMASLSGTLESSMKGLNVGFNETTGSVELQGEALESLITSYENLAKAEATREFLTDAYKKQIEADMKAADAYEKRQEAYNQLTKAEQKQIEAKKRLDTMENDTSYSIEQVKQAQEEYNNLTSEVKQYSNAVSAANEEYSEYLAQQGIAARQIEKLTALQKEAEQGSEDAKKAAANYSEELKKQAETLDKLSEAYKKAESALSSYKSEINELISIQKDLSDGTEYSTTQILDFLDKYPEMAEYIQKSAKGYTVEKEAIEELVNVKAKNLEMTAKQAVEAKRAELSAKGVPDSMLSIFEHGIDSGRIKDIAGVAAGQYTDEVQEYLKAYAKSKGIGNIYADILKDGIMEGAKAESETEKATKKTAKSTTKATKSEAEALIKIFKHRYNQGIIDAETYYKKLDEIAKEYYGNEAGYLERYMELEDEAQAGIKKAIEDKAKSYQTLEDKIEGVTEARKKLLGIESNKNVLAYDESKGFNLEIDKSAYAQASKNLYDAQRQLVTALAEMSGGTGIYEALGNKLADSTAAALESILPEMIDYESVPTTQNYTFNFGDIKASGDAAAFRKMLNDFVNQVINETQVI